MKILLVYATLSGSTMTAAEVITEKLKADGADVTTVMADAAAKDFLKDHEVLVIGSPSWEHDGKDGQPLPEVTEFVTSLTADDLQGKKVAVFGLGDINYPHFCGAVEAIEGLLKERNTTPVIPSLRIDRYYSLPDNEQKVREWSSQLIQGLK